MGNLTLYSIGICTIVATAGFTYGFGFAGFLTSLGEPQFFVYFNLDPTSAYTANILGAVNALFNFGAAIGAITQGWTADWLGRRKALGLAAVFALVGGAGAAGSVAIEMLIIVRIIQGVGLGMLICLGLLYTAEVAPAYVRGLISAMTIMGIGMGYTFCSVVSIGTFYSTNAALTWRLPLALSCVGPLALIIGLFFIPESPRYLVWIKKNDEAWKVIQRLHYNPNDPTKSFARAEFIQIVQQVEFDREQKSGYIQMFTVPSWRRRSLLVMFLFFAEQSTGVLGIANYIVLIFGSLGMSPIMSIVLYTIYSIVGTASIFVVAAFVDKVGRKRMLLVGYPCLAAILLIEAMLQQRYLGTDDKAGNAACLLMIFTFICTYQIVDVPSFALASEIFPTSIRAKGLGLTFFSFFLGAITYSAPAALAFKNIKWGMYLIWVGLCLISEVLVYFFVPETKQMPMEEIGAMFGDKVIVHLTADGNDIVESDKVNLAMFDEVEVVVADDEEKNGTG